MTTINPVAFGVIPARRGSTGVKKKNLRNLCGAPLISYIIESARNSKKLQKVYVSTEDDEIAKVSKECGAEIIRHDPELSGDESPSFFVIRNAQRHLKAIGENPDVIVTLRATSPLCPSFYIDRAVSMLIDQPNADSAISIVKAQVHPYKVLKVGDSGYLEYHDSETTESKYPQRRQKFPDVYIRNAAIYAVRSEVIESGSMWGSKAIPIIMPKDVSVNINEEIDFILAEALMRTNH
ncbi:MAG: acylneuraminate cytidylyltransferase family protein [Candidatus Thiodiazotropha sp. (ex Lucinoma borealis)]|nr:acylneuraminate cytidylyltransferase family protein [Candidatus Thiodiazotropha sp. (ex Lucinoma borealis)]